MEQKVLNEATMIQYLLGLLSEDERCRVEETFFQDDEYFEHLCALEDELIDDYVRDRLPDGFRIAFEEKLKTDTTWMQKLVFARSLRQESESHDTGPEPAASRSFWQLLTSAFRSQNAGFRLALVAGAAAAFAVFFALAWQVMNQRQTLEVLRAERRDAETTLGSMQTELANLQTRDQELSRQLDEERTGRQKLQDELEKNGAPAGLIAAFVLRAGVVRGSDESARLIIPRSARFVRLQLDVETVGDYRSHRALLRTAAGAQVWAGDMLRAQPTDSGKAVVIDVPSPFLAPGNYELALLGLAGDGKFEEAAYYYFSVQ